MKNCIVKIIGNVFEKNDESGLSPLNKFEQYLAVSMRLLNARYITTFTFTLLPTFVMIRTFNHCVPLRWYFRFCCYCNAAWCVAPRRI